MKRRIGKAAHLAGWLLVAAIALAMAAWLVLRLVVVPRADDFRGAIAARASAALRVPVSIGRIDVLSRGWVPSFAVHDVVLKDRGGREALRLARVDASLSTTALLIGRLDFARLRLQAPQMVVRRDAAGHLSVAGFDVPEGSGGDGAAVDEAVAWLLSQHEVAILDGRVRGVDEPRGAAPLDLEAVQAVLRRDGRRHAFRLEATPPAVLGERFTLAARATEPWGVATWRVGAGVRPQDWARWPGEAYALLPRADLAWLRRQVSLPFDLARGTAALRVWVDWAGGAAQHATVDARLRDVSLRLAPALEPIALASLQGRLDVQRDARGIALALDGLTFETTQSGTLAQQRWAPSRIALRWDQAAHGLTDSGLAGAGPASSSSATRRTAAASAAASAVEAARRMVAAASAPGGGLRLPALDAPPIGGTLRADRLDLPVLADVAERLPIGAPLRRLLATTDPRGRMHDLVLAWRGTPDAPTSWRASGRLVGSSLRPGSVAVRGDLGRPGWEGADVRWQASERGGEATLQMRQGAMTFPGVFEEARVPMARLDADVRWQVQPAPAATATSATSAAPGAVGALPAITVEVPRVQFANADAVGEARARWRSGSGDAGFGPGRRHPGVLTLQGKLAQGRADRVARYLPMVLPDVVHQWVRHAVVGGQVHDATYLLDGDLARFPFREPGSGRFEVAAQVRGATLSPVPAPIAAMAAAHHAAPGAAGAAAKAWPLFTDVSGQIRFDRGSMSFRGGQGRLWGSRIDRVAGGIAQLWPRPVLELEGQIHGPAGDLLRWVRETPIAAAMDHALDEARADGPAHTTLAVQVPLDDPVHATVRGNVALQGVDVQLLPDVPVLARATGSVGFTQRSLQIQEVQAQVAGGSAVVSGGSQGDGSLQFAAKGRGSVAGLAQMAPLGALQPPLARAHALGWIDGEADYRVAFGWPGGALRWTVDSDLVGVTVRAPSPLAKPASEARPLKLVVAQQRAAAPAVPSVAHAASAPAVGNERGRLDVGALHVGWERDPRRAGALRYGVGLGDDAPAPRADGAVRAVLPQVDVEGWRGLVSAWSAAAVPAGPRAGAPGAMPADADVPLPGRWSLRLGAVELGLRRFEDLQIEMTRRTVRPHDAWWDIDVAGAPMQGHLMWREPRAGDAGVLNGRLARLAIPAARPAPPADAAPPAASSAAASAEPARVPSVDLSIDRFDVAGRALGALQVEAGPPEGTGAAGWQLHRLTLTHPQARLVATGGWVPDDPRGASDPARRRTRLDFRMDVGDGGALLESLGFGRVLRGARGVLAGHVGWRGSPVALDPATLDGGFNVALAQGQFLQVDPGVGRLLGVLNLQALPRRLTLDFRDVFAEGFSFDAISGDVSVDQGRATTRNLRMRGPQAVVVMSGSADITRETQELRVQVLPELPTGGAALAYAAINPVLGLYALIGQWILAEPLRQAMLREFRVSGPWADPKVERVAATALDPSARAALAAEAAASAPHPASAPAVP